MLKTGDPITFVDDDGETHDGTYHEVVAGDVSPKGRNLAWVSYADGELASTTAKVPFERIRPRDD